MILIVFEAPFNTLYIPSHPVSFSHPSHTSASIKWRAATKDSFDYLRMGNCNREVCPKGREAEFAMHKNPFTERLKLWRELNVLLNADSGSALNHNEL